MNPPARAGFWSVCAATLSVLAIVGADARAGGGTGGEPPATACPSFAAYRLELARTVVNTKPGRPATFYARVFEENFCSPDESVGLRVCIGSLPLPRDLRMKSKCAEVPPFVDISEYVELSIRPTRRASGTYELGFAWFDRMGIPTNGTPVPWSSRATLAVNGKGHERA